MCDAVFKTQPLRYSYNSINETHDRTHSDPNSSQELWLLIACHWTDRHLAARIKRDKRFTIDIGHDQHLRLREPLLQVVKVNRAVKRQESDARARITRQPWRERWKKKKKTTKIKTQHRHFSCIATFREAPKSFRALSASARFLVGTEPMMVKWLTSPDCPVASDTGRSGSPSPQHYGTRPIQTDTRRAEEVAAGERKRDKSCKWNGTETDTNVSHLSL